MSLKYLLDTNVLSEPNKKHPNQQLVDEFIANHEHIATAAQVLYELTFGVEQMPDSLRKQKIAYFLDNVVKATIPILPYDEKAAEWHAKETSRLKKQGINLPFVDTQIAAIAHTNNLILVTRNTDDFRFLHDLKVENWFKY